jgi:phospholipid/cholesterol/gamma-HCH transport system substrate-binding protein
MSTKKRRNDVTTEIVVGAFMFIILVVLLTVSVVISQNKFWEKKVFVQAVFPEVGGLKEGEGVFLRGVKIGNVNKITVPENEEGVLVRLRLTKDLTLYEDYALEIESSSLLGGMRLVILEGSSHLPKVPADQFDRLKGSPVANLLNEATQTIRMIRTSLVEEGTLENIRGLTANLRQISEQINKGAGTIGRLVHEETLYDDARGMVADLRISADKIKSISTRLEDGKGTIGKLLSEDDTLYTNANVTLEQLRLASADVQKIAERVEKGEGTIGKLLSSDDQVYRDLRDTVASLKTFSSDLSAQEGTLGRLIRDDGIYVKVEALVDEARATIDDFRETSPLTTFTSIFFGAF